MIRSLVHRSFYRDSMVLMRVAERLRSVPGVRDAAALMGTPANHELLATAGLETAENRAAGASDLVLVVDATDEAVAESAFAAAQRLLHERQRALESNGRVAPRSLHAALGRLPGANLAVISVPGAHAKLEALTALRRGLHVFLFSDNVSLADEVELKQLAVRRRLLCMGPDCGTAYLGGVGLGFTNVVPRGRIGCVAASGTGLQAVATYVAGLGEGISHGIGVGGRDLSREVGGSMTMLALDALARDPSTEVVVVISKPPAPEVMPTLEAAIRAAGKPVIVCCLGADAGGHGTWVSTLEDAAEAAVAAARGCSWTARAADGPAPPSARGSLLGLYTGGTLAHEARLLIEPMRVPHRIVDLGDDEFTHGRPHPMIDPSTRAARVREAGHSADVGVLLMDVVLGRAVHPDPAGSLSAAIADARASAARGGRALLVVVSVVGTKGDPQGLDGQRAALRAAGAEVLPSNARAARFAAAALRSGPA